MRSLLFSLLITIACGASAQDGTVHLAEVALHGQVFTVTDIRPRDSFEAGFTIAPESAFFGRGFDERPLISSNSIHLEQYELVVTAQAYETNEAAAMIGISQKLTLAPGTRLTFAAGTSMVLGGSRWEGFALTTFGAVDQRTGRPNSYRAGEYLTRIGSGDVILEGRPLSTTVYNRSWSPKVVTLTRVASARAWSAYPVAVTTAIPEPSTWALMLIGAALLVPVVRRQGRDRQ